MRREPHFDRPVFVRLRAVAEEGAEAVEHGLEHGLGRLRHLVGGRARLKVVALLAAVLATASADTGAISAIAPQLERSLHIGNVQIGLLVTVSGLAAAAGMLPVGWVTDRADRMRLVTVAVAVWGVAELASAAAPDYLYLLLVRLLLGGLTAVTGPTLASLTGDLFPARERSRIYGLVLTGELVGGGLGLLVAGLFSSWLSWRVALAVLALPSGALAFALHRYLPEPARGGQSRLQRGADELVTAEEAAAAAAAAAAVPPGGWAAADPVPTRSDERVVAEVRRRRIDPNQGVVLTRDPLRLGAGASLRYVLAVRTNVVLIVASALGYFFYGGVETFALVYLEGHYHVSQAVATIMALVVGAGAVVGAVVGGRLTDRLLDKGRIDARLLVPAAAFALAAVVFLPAVVSASIAASLPLFLVAGACIAAPNPGLDAARLDVLPSRLWGRGEAVRSFLRSILQSFAPLLFGIVSTAFGGRSAGFGTSGGVDRTTASAAGLEPTFLLMLVTLGAAAVVVWLGRGRYPTDVAAAAATERRFPPAGPTVVSPPSGETSRTAPTTPAGAPPGTTDRALPSGGGGTA